MRRKLGEFKEVAVVVRMSIARAERRGFDGLRLESKVMGFILHGTSY